MLRAEEWGTENLQRGRDLLGAQESQKRLRDLVPELAFQGA